MSRVLQLSNAANWEQIYNYSAVAVKINERMHAPIPEIDVPFLIDRHALAVYITTSVPEGSVWYFGGYLNQKFQLGLTVGGIPDADELSRRKLSLDRIKLILFPKITANYSVSLSVPKWFKSVSLTVWQYIGDDYDSVEKLLSGDITSTLERIESKINDL